MREIKFRVWDKDNNQFIDFNSAWMCFYNDGIKVYEGEEEAVSEYENIEINQYTGLKDKNGKEIFEGDIVSAYTGDIKAQIIYNHCGFEFKWLDKWVAFARRRKSEPIFENVSIIFEVIGNIYENPELLK